MTVAQVDRVNPHTGNGVTTVFAYGFRIFEDADLLVEVDGVTQTLTTDYSVTGADDAGGGTVVFVSPPANLTAVTISGELDYDRTTDYVDNGDMLAQTSDDDHDKRTMQIQQLRRDVKRSIKVPVEETTDQEVSLTPTNRADKVLAFDGSGLPTAKSLTDLSSVFSTVGSGLNLLSGDLSASYLNPGVGAVRRTTQGRLDEFVYLTDFLPSGFVTDGSVDYSTEIIAAVTAVTVLGGGNILIPANIDIKINALIAVTVPIIFVGQNKGADGSNQTSSWSSITRIHWGGAASGTMFSFAPTTPAAGAYLHNVGFRNITLAGRDTGDAVAAFGAVFSDCVDPIIDNVRVEVFKTAGIKYTVTNSNVSLRPHISGFHWTWGTNTAAAEASSDGILVDGDGTVGGITQGKVKDISGLCYDGSVIKFLGNTDNWQLRSVQGVTQSGGSGRAVTFTDNTGAGSDSRQHLIEYLSGGFLCGASCDGNRVLHMNSEGAAAGANITSGGQVHYDVLDYVHNDVFATHRYKMNDEYPLAAGDFIASFGGTKPPPSTFGGYSGSWALVNGSQTGVTTTIPRIRDWPDGTINTLRVFYGAAVGDASLAWVVKVRMGAYAVGVNIGTPDYAAQVTATIAATPTNEVAFVDVPVAVTYVRGDIIALEVTRLGADGSDSATSDIEFLGAAMLFTADGPDSAGSGTTWDIPPAYTT